MPDIFDVIIVGAGPAGSAAAFAAAKTGISVLLLEEHPKIGAPIACAEGLGRSKIVDLLDIRQEWIDHEVSGAIVRSSQEEKFRIDYPGVGWVLNREIFDMALAQKALDAGAVVKTSTKAIGIDNNKLIVNEKGKKKTYKFKFLIGADGIASRVGRWLGIDTRLGLDEIAVCAEYLIEDIKIEPQYATFLFSHDYAPGGYAWIFPKSSSSANIGLGISPHVTRKRAKDLLDDWVRKDFPDGKIRRRIYGGVSAKILKKFSGKNFFLVGDAARLTDPLSGAGITNGIRSGMIAGRNVILRLSGKKDNYESEIKKEILNEIKFHLRVRDVYLKLTEEHYDEIFKIGRRIFQGRTIDDINVKHLVKEILFSSPRILTMGFKLLF